MTKQAQALLPDLEKGCYTYLQKTLDAYSVTAMVKGNPFTVPTWRVLVSENDPRISTTSSSVPLLIPQGGTDRIPVVSTKLLFTHLCKIGQDTERRIYPGQGHQAVIKYYMGDMVHWLEDRFAGGLPTRPLDKPVGLPGVTTTVWRSDPRARRPLPVGRAPRTGARWGRPM